jgi:hypothetical protein
MKSISAAAVLLLGVCAASAQTLDDLKSDGRNTDNIRQQLGRARRRS